jgi:homoserine O-acetyltransferase/O-succinyltransferase
MSGSSERRDSGRIRALKRLHYRTLGRPERDTQGIVRNAVLIMHGTCGSGPGRRGERFAQDRRCE